MRPALAAGIALLRREPALLWVLFIASAGPAILGLLPLDRALAPLLDLQPAARALVDGTMDDALLGELRRGSPTLPAVAVGGALIALVLAIPGCWLATAFIAARALDAALSGGQIASRGIGAALMTLPLRLLPIGSAALLLGAGRNAHTLAAARPFLVAATLLYTIGSAAVTVVADFARGTALADPRRPLPAVLAAALRTTRREPALFVALIAGELALLLCCLAALAITRPLGVYQGTTLAIGMGALIVRAAGSVVLIAAAATGAASRSA